MQYSVPQFTDVEDRLIGPLTLKQFLSLVATGGVVMFFWSIFGLNIFFFAFAVPFAFIGMGITFGKFNGRSLFQYVVPFINYMASPKVMIFHRDENSVKLITFDKPEEKKNQALEVHEAPVSRLKSLAYTLDQKIGQENELISSTQIKK